MITEAFDSTDSTTDSLMEPVPERMRAAVTTRYGAPDGLELREVPTPSPGSREVLVRVRASSMNPVDWKVRRGEVRAFSGLLGPPRILGADFAGDVVAVGSGVVDYAPGDAVFGMVRAFRGGAHAEYLAVHADDLAPMPRGLSYQRAAALPLVSLTVAQCLAVIGDAARRPRLLVNGCTGGLGHVAVQLARAKGFEVIGVCSGPNAELARRLGAHRVIDYRTQDPLDADERYDAFFDAAATQSFARVRPHLTERGVYVGAVPDPCALLVAPIANVFRGRTHRTLWVAPNGPALREIAAAVEAGHLAPVIAEVFALDRIRDAHAASERGGVAGKIGIALASDAQRVPIPRAAP